MTQLNRRTLLTAAAGTALTTLAACDEATMTSIQARLNPTQAAGGSGVAANAPTQAAAAEASAVSQTVRMPGEPWTFARFNAAMEASRRPHTLTEAQFTEIQARKPAAIERIRTYLDGRFGAADPNVVQAFESVPRDYFHYAYAAGASTAYQAYEANPKPWAIGHGSVLSDYLGQAYMTQLAAPKPTDVTLEIGTGSGFQSSLLSRIVRDAYTIEIIEPIGRAVDQIFAPLGYDNVHGKVGDGYFGWPEVTEGFDTIMLTCVAQYAPPELFRQLKPGGKLIIPIGQPFRRGQVLYVYTKDADGRVRSRRDVGVFFIPMTGAMQTQARPA
ncbi:protein-L-isoaspartate O-methyltransferase family protein [Brevundimonas subvibrioides]|uniref:Protein-L-isoaspartate O-methyltransferase n=1 Tax=Brevundimonas subvibrioides (strain ATCC 15264 / DSM 4735 / LMG 14903 / NBRC 16000 / CB 81) TaxID=633149 RepID=D9QNU3_BRESC|nr:protein-L-isoaspartate O-methyltransferase [Brevundimonas subvibrioides]ADL00376.1 Protein-L-isoaspartate(D-aspartate) O-methyltransferase [Brevundimonas subvibrioides ATCC 15264]